MAEGQRLSAGARYAARFWTGIFWYVAILFAAVWWLNHAPPEGALRYILAAAPAAPIVGVIAAMGVYLKEEPDEFSRAIIVEAMVWAIGLVLAFATVWGFLEELAGIPHLPLYAVFPIFCGAMGLSQVLIRLRYQ